MHSSQKLQYVINITCILFSYQINMKKIYYYSLLISRLFVILYPAEVKFEK